MKDVTAISSNRVGVALRSHKSLEALIISYVGGTCDAVFISLPCKITLGIDLYGLIMRFTLGSACLNNNKARVYRVFVLIARILSGYYTFSR